MMDMKRIPIEKSPSILHRIITGIIYINIFPYLYKMITFVTAYMTIYNESFQNKDQTWRFAHFEKLCQTGISIAVFCSRDVESVFREEILEKYPNVLLFESLDLSETQAYQTLMTVEQEHEIELPGIRRLEKDTREYMLLMNSKTEFLQRVIQKNPFGSTHFAWIDFSIFYIFKGREVVCQKMLSDMSKRTLMPRFLTMAGCWDWGRQHMSIVWIVNEIMWRFCGGFFLGSADLMLEFHNKNVEYFKIFLQRHKRLVWEVNLWADLELTEEMSFNVFPADHNERMLEIDAGFTAKVLVNQPSFSSVKYSYPDRGEYIPTSSSYVCHKGIHYVNTRWVNYWLYPNGGYWIKDPERWIRTRNTCSILPTIDGLPDGYKEMDMKGLPCYGGSIYGLEDIRLYSREDGHIGFIATSVNHSPLLRNRMVRGIYDVDGLRECRVLVPPDPGSWCEKNWIPLSLGDGSASIRWIYRWSPFELGVLQETEEGGEQLVIEISLPHSTPMFSKIRGSSPFVETEEGLVGVVHMSYEGCPRRYLHCLVLLDKMTGLPLRYTDFFVFREVSIEFCIGFTIDSGRYHFWISNFDRDPEVVSVDRDAIPWLFDFLL